MKALIILGNRLNDDASLSEKGLKRCEFTVRAYDIFHPDRVILSGGVANEKAGISEAEAMFRELVSRGMREDLFLLERDSRNTDENAMNSFAICQKEGIGEVVVISTIEHFGRSIPKNAVRCFRDAAKRFPDIHLTMYTEEY